MATMAPYKVRWNEHLLAISRITFRRTLWHRGGTKEKKKRTFPNNRLLRQTVRLHLVCVGEWWVPSIYFFVRVLNGECVCFLLLLSRSVGCFLLTPSRRNYCNSRSLVKIQWLGRSCYNGWCTGWWAPKCNGRAERCNDRVAVPGKPNTPSNGLANSNFQHTLDAKIQWLGSASVTMVDAMVEELRDAMVRLKGATIGVLYLVSPIHHHKGLQTNTHRMQRYNG